MLGYARSRIAQSPHRHLRVARGDLYHLGQYRQHADFVTMHQVLHFLTHPGSALRTAASLLRPDGKILIVDFAPHNLDQLRETSGHVRLGIAHEQMERWLAEADLELLQAETLPPDNDPDDQQLTVSLWLARRMGDKALAA